MRDPRKHRWKIVQLTARQLPHCQAITHLISDSRDRKLSIRERLIVWVHLNVCAFCTRFRHQIQCIETALEIAGHDPEKLLGMNSGLSETARIEIRKRLKSAD